MSRKPKDNLLDEAAFLTSGLGITYSASQYARLRKDLFRAYTKNAWKISGKPFSQKGYRKWLESYLTKINRLRTSPKSYQKGEALFRDLKHFNPKMISKRSSRLIPKSKIKSVISMNKRSFRKIAPKRIGLFAAGLATAATLPALAYKYQGRKDWKKSIKENTLQIAAPTVALSAAYLKYKYKF